MRAKIVIATLTASLLLGGCSKLSNNSKTSSTSISSTTKVSNSAKEKMSSSSSSTVASSISSKTSSVKEDTTDSRIQELNQKLSMAIGTTKKPTVDGLNENHNRLNMHYISNAYGYTVYYSVGATAKEFNASTLASETPYATFNKTAYVSKAAAVTAVNHHAQETGLPVIDLGSGVQGTIDRGAGQAYLTWQAGRWSVTVHASPVMGQDPVAMSKQLVALFNQYSLPIPSQVGAGNFDVTDNGLNQTITWQEGAILYKISARSAETAIKMASSMSR